MGWNGISDFRSELKKREEHAHRTILAEETQKLWDPVGSR